MQQKQKALAMLAKKLGGNEAGSQGNPGNQQRRTRGSPQVPPEVEPEVEPAVEAEPEEETDSEPEAEQEAAPAPAPSKEAAPTLSHSLTHSLTHYTPIPLYPYTPYSDYGREGGAPWLSASLTLPLATLLEGAIGTP